jgi:hypothetical protein
MMASWDVFILLDGGYRIVDGQVPDGDFANPIGPLVYIFVSLGVAYWLQVRPHRQCSGYRRGQSQAEVWEQDVPGLLREVATVRVPLGEMLEEEVRNEHERHRPVVQQVPEQVRGSSTTRATGHSQRVIRDDEHPGSAVRGQMRCPDLGCGLGGRARGGEAGVCPRPTGGRVRVFLLLRRGRGW